MSRRGIIVRNMGRRAGVARGEGLTLTYATPWGPGTVWVVDGSLRGVELPRLSAAADLLSGSEGSEVRASSAAVPADLAAAEEWVEALEAYFRGERLAWQAHEVPWEALGLGDFQRRVYEVLLTVPPAVTLSYGTLAEWAGYPRAARAVGTAMATNPLPVVIPCHRVIRADGSLGRYGSDPSWKPRLLEHETSHLEAARPDATHQEA